MVATNEFIGLVTWKVTKYWELEVRSPTTCMVNTPAPTGWLAEQDSEHRHVQHPKPNGFTPPKSVGPIGATPASSPWMDMVAFVRFTL